MTRIITYSLKAGRANSDEYYRTIAAFADEWLEQTRPETPALVGGFRAFREGRGEADRSDAEYLFELLALGVLLREHGEEASRTPGWATNVLRWLVKMQKQQPQAEQAMKKLRGWLGWAAGLARGEERSADRLGRLIAWLEADDESAKAERLGEWREYFISEGNPFMQASISRCLQLAEEFNEASLEALGGYTEHVERFLKEEAPKHRRRYDARLLTRTRLEYHLGMLGTEILSRAFRQRFLATKHKMVILPPCMCAPAEKCKTIETPLGAKCQACTPTCRVHQVTKLGEKRGFTVTMIPDDVKVFGSGKGAEHIGLVGVACALTNWNGGWEAGAAGIPAQGLLLDYVGCAFHWDKKGFPTDTNLNQLQKILGI